MLSLALVLAQTNPRPILLDVDATEALRCVLRVKETLPEAKGHVRLSLLKWMPGEHQASGTINAIVRLHFLAGENELSWTPGRGVEPASIPVGGKRHIGTLSSGVPVRPRPGPAGMCLCPASGFMLRRPRQTRKAGG